MEKFQYREYLLEEPAMLAAASLIRETKGFDALVDFAHSVSIKPEALFKKLLHVSVTLPKRARGVEELRRRFARILVHEGHTRLQIGKMLGYQGTDRVITSAAAALLSRAECGTIDARTKLQKTNPRISALLEKLTCMEHENRENGSDVTFSPEIIETVETILRTTEIPQKEIAFLLRCDLNSLRITLHGIRNKKPVAREPQVWFNNPHI